MRKKLHGQKTFGSNQAGSYEANKAVFPEMILFIVKLKMVSIRNLEL